MQQANVSLLQSKRQILQKDLSFSNEIFKRSFNYENIHSSKSSHQNLTKNNSIPPLIKYTDTIASQNIHQNHYHQQLSTHTQKERKQKLTQQKRQLSLQQQQQLSIFQRKNKMNFNAFNINKSVNKQQKHSSIPSLSKLQEKIAKKYQRKQVQYQQQKQAKPTTVYFDNTQSYQQEGLINSSRNKILNIQSLEQSRIANHSIERHNNWIINNIGDSSGFFQDNNNTLLINLSKKELSRKNINRSLMNNSFRNMNPLQLVNNSLHLSHLPEFVQDEQLSQHNYQVSQLNAYQRGNENQQMNVKTIQQRLRVFNTVNNNQQPNVKSKDREQRRQVNFKKLTLDLYQYYVVPHFGHSSKSNEFINQFETSSIPDSILINDFQPQNNKGFDLLTTKSTPIHNLQKNSPYIENYKTISEINEHLYIEENSFEESQSNLRYGKSHQHFINDKTSQQIVSAILSDPNKMKLYIKYLQLQIALNNNNSQNIKINENYQLLSCMLIKINEIADKRNEKNLQLTPKSLAESILSLNQLKHHKQNNHSLQQRQLSNNNIKPQIIRSSNGIKINFDPYLTYETDKINSRISYIKKCLQQKNKQSQLIKLNYDSIIHNYASTLENIAKNNKQNDRNNLNKQRNPYSQTQNQNQQNQNQHQNLSSNRKSQHQSQRFQQKNYLQININKNRSSFQENKIHRKATFGKVPSSFKGSDILDY